MTAEHSDQEPLSPLHRSARKQVDRSPIDVRRADDLIQRSVVAYPFLDSSSLAHAVEHDQYIFMPSKRGSNIHATSIRNSSAPHLNGP